MAAACRRYSRRGDFSAVATNKPLQRRSRERVEKIMLAAADELARTADADTLTTTSVAKRSGIPVATIYRYFADRSAIISALIDRETSEMDHALDAELQKLETVDFQVLFTVIMEAHLRYFTSNRRSIVLWFGARNSKEVLGRIERRYEYMGEWLLGGAIRAGMAVPDAPEYGGELIVWTCDRAFEFMFREKRPLETQREIMGLAIEMLLNSIDQFTTDVGRAGIDHETFAKAFGPFDPPVGSPN